VVHSILVWFSTLLLAFFNRRRKRRAGKAPNSRNEENRGAEEAKEIYFLRDFPLNLKKKGEFFSLKREEQTTLSPLSHTTSSQNT